MIITITITLLLLRIITDGVTIIINIIRMHYRVTAILSSFILLASYIFVVVLLLISFPLFMYQILLMYKRTESKKGSTEKLKLKSSFTSRSCKLLGCIILAKMKCFTSEQLDVNLWVHRRQKYADDTVFLCILITCKPLIVVLMSFFGFWHSKAWYYRAAATCHNLGLINYSLSEHGNIYNI